MEQKWRSFLIQAGAVFKNDSVLYFRGSREKLAALPNTIITDLSHLGLIAIAGEEARVFLQNLLTNDIREVNDQRSQLTGLCNPKGRLFAIFQLFQWNTHFYLSLPHSILESTLKRLSIYILRTRVSLINDSDHYCRFGLAGLQADNMLAQLLNITPLTANEVYQTPNLCIIRMPDQLPRFEIMGEFNFIQELWNELKKAADPVGTRIWELLTIRAGIARIYPETQELFIPQQVNLELSGGVSFTKGCYPGQEIIARMHYRGKPSRRMLLAYILTDKPPKPADPLYVSNNNDKEHVGEIVAAESTLDGGYDSLVVLHTASLEKGEIVLNNEMKSKLIFQKLPYEVPL
ncbi:glycine cleavage system protein T [Candidatus Nitrosoglobus terrae]|uniref:Glycine cleavage system protein T n=1 Tax=Candidatus Nitrosoglobus terrae TaxID=1630141 RepID=A0A1Q2SP14_9GAMM|nr:folate-binding protein YgfZ [Candidatus Nitrosoglobus terrae]BAW80866.1 glycine cleavage system protein T [Candidatus Nitrosoglobus terrae]